MSKSPSMRFHVAVCSVEEESVFNTTKSQMQDASRWFFTLGFVGIGLSSEFKSLYAKLMGGADVRFCPAYSCPRVRERLRSLCAV